MEFDFTTKYKKGDIIFLARYIESVGIQEVLKLKLITVTKTYMVGNADKSNMSFIGRDMKDKIFPTQKEAKAHLESIVKKPYVDKCEDIPNQLCDEDESEDDVYSYIDGDSED
jgi:hypothetical protein